MHRKVAGSRPEFVVSIRFTDRLVEVIYPRGFTVSQANEFLRRFYQCADSAAIWSLVAEFEAVTNQVKRVIEVLAGRGAEKGGG